jgi:hypothetical protein
MAYIKHDDDSTIHNYPTWAGEAIAPYNLIPGGAQLDATQFPASDAFTVTVTAAETASATATIAVEELEGSLPAGYTLNLGSGKYATLNSKAMKGATNLDANLTGNLTGNETAVYAGISGKKLVKAGTLVGRTYAERDAGTAFGPANAATDDEIFLLAFTVRDATECRDCELLRHQTLVRDHLLPGWSGFDATAKAKIRSLYQCVRGPVVA